MATATGLDELRQYRSAIESALDAFFEESLNLLGVEQSRHGLQALHRLQDYCLRPAKRLRGSLAAMTYDMAAQTKCDPAAIQLGVVLELMQGYLLIVDDAMDRSELRRGEATMHELYKSDGIDAHEADMIAINTGLLAQHLASLGLARIDVPAEALVFATQIMQRNVALTGLGQLDDLRASLEGGLTEDDILHKYVQKSSYYTFVNPLQLGFALAGNSDEAVMTACEMFGKAAGIAFQLHDDYLGMFGTADSTGKSNLDDLREGKVTLLIQYANAHAQSDEIKVLQQLLGKSDASETDLKVVQDILRNSGAEEYCRVQAEHYAQVARQVLKDQRIGTAVFRQILSDIVDYSVTREK